MTSIPVPQKEGEQIDGLLRIVSNRCRNLRKAIERASLLEKAREGGKEMKQDQLQSIEMKTLRVAQLHELEEILRKQEALVTPPKLSKRAAKRLAKEKNHLANQASGSENGSDATKADPGGKKADSGDGTDSLPEKASDANTSTDGDLDRGTPETRPLTEACPPPLPPPLPATSAEKEQLQVALHQLQELQASYERQVDLASRTTLNAVLEIAHVVTFISQPAGREFLRNAFAFGYAGLNSRTVTDMDMDILIYFYRMLTSPNGNVPHEQAVRTSVAHCAAYLEASDAEAFSGTTYATLREIVRSIASCPLLSQRAPTGAPAGGQHRVEADVHVGPRQQMALSKTGDRVVNPSSMVHEAAVMRSHF